MSHRDHHDDAGFDTDLRALHRSALQQLSPATLASLRAGRAQAQAAPARRAWPWLAATAFSGVLAVTLGLQFLPGSGEPTPAGTSVASATDSASNADLLDENPDLYLWLASSDAQPLAME